MRRGFTLLEVMIALAILAVSLLAVFQSQSSSLFILGETQNLRRANSYIQERLLFWERSKDPPPVSVNQGTFPNDHELAGWRWFLTVEDIDPLPGITVRRVNYRLEWQQGGNTRSFDADLYVRAQ